jgi:hypothetical protein
VSKLVRIIEKDKAVRRADLKKVRRYGEEQMLSFQVEEVLKLQRSAFGND